MASARWSNRTACSPPANWPSGSAPSSTAPMSHISINPRRSPDPALVCRQVQRNDHALGAVPVEQDAFNLGEALLDVRGLVEIARVGRDDEVVVDPDEVGDTETAVVPQAVDVLGRRLHVVEEEGVPGGAGDDSVLDGGLDLVAVRVHLLAGRSRCGLGGRGHLLLLVADHSLVHHSRFPSYTP